MQQNDLSRRSFLKGGFVGLASFTLGEESVRAETKPFHETDYGNLSQWCGFNLLEKFNGQNRRFVEDDFRWISGFGFNFVRLPMDYRMWIKEKDWRKFDEKTLDEIDEAVQLGEKYGIHVCINFHRAPGYTVAQPPEKKSIWKDKEALEVCVLHWKTFAKRYKGISNNRISFNLFNEPGTIDDLSQCIAVHKTVINGIREEDSNRLIICDGYEWGNQPFVDLADQKIAQATRGYAPNEISHYKASWVGGENFPLPTWPLVSGNGLLLSENKREIQEEFRRPLVLNGPFPNKTKLRMHVGTVSSSTSLAVFADGKTIFEHQFKPGAGEGEWKTSVYKKEWNIYQNVYDRDYETIIPANIQKVEIRTVSGDWISLTQIAIQSEMTKKEAVIELSANWNQKPSVFQYRESGNMAELIGGSIKDRTWLAERLEPWKELQKKGCGVIVGEFGAYAPCPHDVALRWMADGLQNWREAGWGYALWNFRGSFGVIDSGRTDVDYEEFHGHKLDRKMLRLLQN